MGATSSKVFGIVVLEGLALAFIGGIIGLFLGRVALWMMSKNLENSFHYSVSQWSLLPEEWILAASTLGVGILAALIPAITTLSLDISKTLGEK